MGEDLKAQMSAASGGLKDQGWDSDKNRLVEEMQEEVKELDSVMAQAHAEQKQKLEERLQKAADDKRRKAEAAAALAQKQNAEAAAIMREATQEELQADLEAVTSNVVALEQNVAEKLA